MSEQSLAVRQALGVERLGEIMFKSGYWQDTRSQSQAIVKILRGAELDIGPIASMDGVYIIEGKTSLNATLMASLIQRSGRYRYRVIEHDDKHCVIDFFEIVGGKRDKLGTSSFSLEDAKTAGLLGTRSRMWEKYPRNMVFSRALSNGAKWYTPDVFNGPVYTPDELGAEINEEGNVVDVEPHVPTREQDRTPAHPPAQRVVNEGDALWDRWLSVRSEALKVGIVPPSLSAPVGYDQLVANATMLKAQTEAKLAQLAREDAARAAAQDREAEPPSGEADAEPLGTQEGLPAPVTPADAWARNKALMTEAYASGIKMSELPHNATLDEIDERNQAIQKMLVG